jgi:hypothetical protein
MEDGLPYRIMTNDGAPRLHQASSASAALGYVLVHRAAYPEMVIMSDDGVTLSIEQLKDIAAAADNLQIRRAADHRG